jgi:DNA-binding beta-propeller fold protein YncE
VNRPKGLACDADGRLYVCNYGGGNVAVYSPRGGLLKSFKVKHPQALAVHPKTGRIYVLAGEELGYAKYGYDFEATLLESRLLRLAPDGKVERELKLPDAHVRDTKTRPGPSYQLRFAADFSGEGAVIWLGVADPSAREVKWNLLRVEDGSAGFSEPREICPRPNDALVDPPLQLALDRQKDVLYVHDACRRLLTSRLARFTGKGEALPPLLLGKEGEEPYNFSEIALGPDGHIYTTAWQGLWGGSGKTTLMRFDRAGKPVPFTAGTDAERLIRSMKGARGSSSRGMTVAPDGRVYVLYYDGKRPEEGRQPWERGWDLCTALARFSADGKLLDPHLVAYLRAGAQCVRVAADGAIYVGDNTMPVGTAYPREIARGLPDPFKREYVARLPGGGLDPLLRWMGSVFRFAPGGGRVTGLPENDRTPAARPPRGDLWRPAPEVQWFLFNDHRVRLTGAEWQFHGFAPLPVQYQGVTHVERCVCSAGRFDLDEFGRLFVPDALRHRVTVLDAAGNEVTRFGSYGNADSEGPEIGLADPWWVAAASDRVYVGEQQACRIVKVRLECAAAAECAVRLR